MEVRGEEKEGGQKGVNKDKEGKGWKREGEQGGPGTPGDTGPSSCVTLVFF